MNSWIQWIEIEFSCETVGILKTVLSLSQHSFREKVHSFGEGCKQRTTDARLRHVFPNHKKEYSCEQI